MSYKEVPQWLSHKPIVSVDYSEKDAYAGDARFLSLGKATWNAEEISAKIFRWADEGERWSRQGEELPLWRLLDLTKLLLGVITGQQTTLEEGVVDEEGKAFLDGFIQENMMLYQPRIHEIVEMLSGFSAPKSDSKTPNIFSFATSELSQDALFAYLICWADDSYLQSDREMCLLGKAFLSLLSDIPYVNIHKVNVGRQWRNIDVWVEINDNCFLAIEDKTGTSIHSNQLCRYKEIVEEEYEGKMNDLRFVYVKTENEPCSIEKQVHDAGYKTVNRVDLLSVLDGYQGHSPIVLDYRKHLQEIEDKTNRFMSISVDKWDWYAWQGFYKHLETHIDVRSWEYVSNPAGGFLGLWWHFVPNDEIEMYLQFEEQKLCIKIMYDGTENRSDVRWRYHNRLMEKAGEMGVRIEKPVRFGAGTYMTIGIVPAEDLFGEGLLDMEQLVSKLRVLESLVDNSI